MYIKHIQHIQLFFNLKFDMLELSQCFCLCKNLEVDTKVTIQNQMEKDWQNKTSVHTV